MSKPISERLRNEVNIGSGTVTPLRCEAADVIDALVAALEAVRDGVPDVLYRERLHQVVDAAIAKARP